jgi:hypothetical protein
MDEFDELKLKTLWAKFRVDLLSLSLFRTNGDQFEPNALGKISGYVHACDWRGRFRSLKVHLPWATKRNVPVECRFDFQFVLLK